MLAITLRLEMSKWTEGSETFHSSSSCKIQRFVLGGLHVSKGKRMTSFTIVNLI